MENIEKYRMAFVNVLKDAYIDMYIEAFQGSYDNYEPFKEKFNIFQYKNSLKKLSNTFDNIFTYENWCKNPLVQELHSMFSEDLELDDGTIASNYKSFSLEEEIGYWLYYYEDIPSVLEAIDNNGSDIEITVKAREILSNMLENKDFER